MSNYLDAIIPDGTMIFLAQLSPENMQELEAMIRRVVAEELAKVLPEEDQEEEIEPESPYIGRD